MPTKKKQTTKPKAAGTTKPAKPASAKSVNLSPADESLQAWERCDSIELAPDESEK